MSSIDERIVEMRFQNGQFEKGIDTTLSSLDRLKQGLKLENAVSGIEAVGQAAGNMRLDGIAGGVDTIASKFNALGAIGFSVLNNLTTKALSFGAGAISSILDPIISGGEKRATNISQAKFMLEGLGVAWEDVAGSIDYAVKGTAFGLDEAALAASSLSASNVQVGSDMDKALRGISGVAAMTSSSYGDIAQVFTTVAGNGRLMASELNRVGARGINAAAALADYLGVSESAVREMTSKGEIDFNTFAAAMDNAFGENATKMNELYTGSLANVRAALARIGQVPAEGKFEQLRQIFVSLIPKIDEIKNALLPLLNLFKDMQIESGRKLAEYITNIDLSQLPEGFQNITDGFKNLIDIGKTFGDIIAKVWKKAFPSKGPGTWFITLTKGFKDLTGALKPSEGAMNGFQNVMTVIAEVAATVWHAITRLWDVLVALGGVFFEIIGILWDFISPFFKLGDGVDDTSEKIGGFFDLLKDGIDKGLDPLIEWLGKVKDGLKDLREGGSSGIDWLDTLYGTITKFSQNGAISLQGFFADFRSGFESMWVEGSLLDKLMTLFADVDLNAIDWSNLDAISDWVSVTFGGIGQAFQTFWDTINPISTSIKDTITSMGDNIWEFLGKIEMKDVALGTQVLGVLGTLIMIWQTVSTANEAVKSFSGLMQSTSGLLDAFKDNISGTSEVMKGAIKIGTILAIAAAIGLMAWALYKLASLPWQNLLMGTIALGVLAALLGGMMILMDKMAVTMTKERATKIGIMALALLALSLSILLMSFAVEKLAAIPFWDLVAGIGAIAIMFLLLSGTSKYLSAGSPGIVKSSFSILILAAALFLLVEAIKAFAAIPTDDLLKGGISVAIAIALLSGAMTLMSLPKNNANVLKAAAGILLMVGAIFALYWAINLFADMDPMKLAYGITIVAGLLLGLVAIALLLSTASEHIHKAGAALLMMGGALLLMAAAIWIMSSIAWEDMYPGAVTLAALMGAFAIMVKYVDGANPLKAAGAMLIMSGALIVMAIAIRMLTDLDPGRMLAAAGALAILTVGIGIMLKIVDGVSAMKGAVAFLVVAGALLVLAWSIQMLAALDVNKMIYSAVALGLLTIAIGMMLEMLSNSPNVLGAAAAFAIAALSLWVMADALVALSAIDTGSLMMSVLAIGIVLVMIGLIAALLAVIPGATAVLIGLALVIGALSLVLFGLGFVIAMFTELLNTFMTLVQFFIDNAQAIVDSINILVQGILGISEHLPTLMLAGMAFTLLGIGLGALAIGIGLISVALLLLALGIMGIALGLAMLSIMAPLGIVAMQMLTEAVVNLIPHLFSFIGAGIAIGLLGVGLAAFGIGAAFAAIGILAFGMAIMIALPGIMMMPSLLMMLGSAAIAMVPALLPLAGLAITLGLFGIAAATAALGIIPLSIGMIMLGVAMQMLGSYASGGTAAVSEFLDMVIDKVWHAASIATMAVSLTALGLAMIGLGAGMLLAGAGSMMAAIAFALITGVLPGFTAALQGFADAAPGMAESIATAMTTLGTAVQEQLPPVSVALGEFATVSYLAAAGMMALGAGMLTFSSNATAFGIALMGLKDALPEAAASFSTNMTSMASTMQNAGPQISSAMAGLEVAIRAGIEAMSSGFAQLGITMMTTLSTGITQGMSTVQSVMSSGIRSILQSTLSLVVGMATIFTVGGVLMGMALAGGLSSTRGAVGSAARVLIMAASTGMLSGRALATAAGRLVAMGFTMGIVATSGRSQQTGLQLAQAAVRGMLQGRTTANSAGRNVAQSFVNGLRGGLSSAASIGNSGGYSVGSNIAAGARNGIYSGTSGVINAAISMAAQAISAAKNRLAIRSPSREFMYIGDMTAQGMVKGIHDSTGDVVSEVDTMGSKALNAMRSAVEGISDGIDTNLDMSPTIRPVLDMSDVERNASMLGSLLDFSKMQPITTAGMVQGHYNDLIKQQLEMSEKSKDEGGTTRVYNFNQTNNSPKSLSTIDIYRNTKNLVSKAEKVGEEVDA